MMIVNIGLLNLLSLFRPQCEFLLFFFGSRRWNLTDYGCWIHPTKSIANQSEWWRWTPFSFTRLRLQSLSEFFLLRNIEQLWVYTMYIHCIYIVYTVHYNIYIYTQYHGHAPLPACIGGSTCTSVCVLAVRIEQLLFVFCDPPKKGQIRTKNGVGI